MGNRSDNFNRSNGVIGTPSDAGSAYVTHQPGGSANWEISSNVALLSNNVDGVAILDAVASPLTVEVVMPSIGEDVGVILRANATGTTGIIVSWGDAGNVIKCHKRTAGNATFGANYGANVSTAIADGDTITVLDSGTAITVKVNGATVATFNGGDIATYNIAETYAGLFAYGSGTGTFDSLSIVTPATLTADRDNVLTGSGTVTVTLTGTGTSWTGTPFSLTGAPTGWSISSQNVASGTSATVTLNKGSGTGAFSVTDGTLSDTLTATNTATTVASGNSNTAATWDVIEVPASTNDVVVATGHTLTVNANLTIDDLTASGTGAVTVAAGVTLTLDTATIDNGVFQLGEAGGGANLIFGASFIVGGNNDTSSRFRTRGTGGSITSTASGTIDVHDGLYDIQGTGTMEDLGDGSTDSLEIHVTSASTGTHVFSGWTRVNCGRINTENTLPAGMGLSYTDMLEIQASAGAASLRLAATTPSGGVTRVVADSSFYGACQWSEGTFDVTGCVLDAEGGGLSGSGSWAAGQFDDNFVRMTATSGGGIVGFPIRGTTRDCYFLPDAGTNNPHGILPRDAGYEATLSGCIYEYTRGFTDDSGDWFYGEGDWILEECILLPAWGYVESSGDYQASGALNMPTGVGKVRHCTLHAGLGYGGGLLLGDGNAMTDSWLECKSNIFWQVVADEAEAQVAGAVGDAQTVDNVLNPGGTTHNGRLNIGESPVYQGDYPTTQPGANDVTLSATDPTTVFVDHTRNIATWAVSRGSVSATYADKVTDARSYLRADPSLVADLIAHVRYGFRVKNATWRTAAHDATVLGAVQDAAPSEAAAWRMLLLGVG